MENRSTTCRLFSFSLSSAICSSSFSFCFSLPRYKVPFFRDCFLLLLLWGPILCSSPILFCRRCRLMVLAWRPYVHLAGRSSTKAIDNEKMLRRCEWSRTTLKAELYIVFLYRVHLDVPSTTAAAVIAANITDEPNERPTTKSRQKTNWACRKRTRQHKASAGTECLHRLGLFWRRVAVRVFKVAIVRENE